MEIPVAVILFVLNVLTGVIMYFMKQTYDGLKQTIQVLQSKQDRFTEDYLKKEDFREFKEELWKRFDDLKVEIRTMGHK